MPNPLLDSIPGFKINCLCLGNFHSKEAAQERMNRDNGTKLSIEKLCIVADQFIQELITSIGLPSGKWTSSGVLAIDWIREAFEGFNCEYEIFYHGFSFYKESGKRLEHYFPITTKRDDCHDFGLESKYIELLEKAGKVRELKSLKSQGHLALLSHYPPNRSSSPCTSVYWGILNQYTGFKSHHIQTFKADLKQELKTLEDIFLSRGENEKIVLLFNGICSFLLSYEFIDGFRRLLSKYTSSDWRLGVYWHETAWNA